MLQEHCVEGIEVLLPDALYKIDKQCQDLTAISGQQNEGGPMYILRILQKFAQSQLTFTGHQQSQTVFGLSQIMSLHGLSTKYGDIAMLTSVQKVVRN